MTAQEQQLIEQLFQDLRQQANQPKDPQVDAAIRQQVAYLPDAAYWLCQRVLLQDMALQQAQQRIEQLQNQPPSGMPPSGVPPSASFLPSSPDTQFGRGSSASYAPAAPAPSNWRERWFGAAPAPAPAVPATGSPAAGSPAAGLPGGGFLSTAAASAAGVAGGMLLFNGLHQLMGQHGGHNGAAASNSTSQPLADSGNDGLNQLAQDAGRDHVDPSLLDDSYGSNDDDGGFLGGGDDDFA